MPPQTDDIDVLAASDWLILNSNLWLAVSCIIMTIYFCTMMEKLYDNEFQFIKW